MNQETKTKNKTNKTTTTTIKTTTYKTIANLSTEIRKTRYTDEHTIR